MSALDSGHCKVLIVPEEPALRGGRVAVWQGSPAEGTAVLSVDGRRGVVTVGVRAAPHAQVPAGVMVVPDGLAARLGLHPGAAWQLVPAQAVPLTALTIEAMVEEPADDLWRAVREDGDLLGQCLWAGHDVGSNVLEIRSRQFRVRAIDQPELRAPREVVASTQIELFIPGARVGLDVVILADCSGSMEVDDLPVTGEGIDRVTVPYRTRLDALKEALRHMLQARLRIAGRESRIALLRFTDHTQQRFPAGEGMISLDGTSPPQVIEAFERAVQTLDIGGGTDIAGALLRAAELLDKHGKPGNDRLVVLVSDGRPWVPKNADATGEVVFAVDDPVSLMSHLYLRRNVRVHAIGISNDELYERWLRRRGYRDGVGLRPDHPLLERLVEVGGGDPTRIGGIDVLEGYFSGLGAGLTRHVGHPAQGTGVRNLAETTVSLLRQNAGGDLDERCRAAARRLADGMPAVNEYARRLAGRQLGPWTPFDMTDGIHVILNSGRLLTSVGSEDEFIPVLNNLHKVMVEQGPGRRNREGATMPEVLSGIYDCFRQFVGRLNPIRQVHLHDKTGGSAREQRDLESCVAALRHYLGVINIEPNDAARWSELRLLLLEDAARCTEDALNTARQVAGQVGVSEAEPAPETAPAGRPADHSMEFDLRVRN